MKIIALILACLPLFAQQVDIYPRTSIATTTKGTSTPSACMAPSFFIRTDTQALYMCIAGAFVAVGGGGGGSSAWGGITGTLSAQTDLQNALDLKAPTASPTFSGTVGGVTKSMVGLGSVDNTADTAKPVSTAAQSALDLKAPIASPTFTGTVGGITKAMVSLGSVDNTADTAKPISTATQTALDLKAPLASPTLTGTVTIGATVLKAGGPGVINVRLQYGAVPDGSTDNATAIAAAFTNSNGFTTGVPTVYFDCNTNGQTTCQYNYGGSGISPINPLRATTIMCAPGATLNYTGTAHAADIGPTTLTQGDEEVYTIQGCRWTGGANYTAGLYFNEFVLNPHIVGNHFWNFGNQTGYTLVFPGNNWMPLVTQNRWTDTNGFSKNMVDAHTGINVGIDFSLNKSECLTAGGGACSVSTVGVGLWIPTGRVTNNEIKFHAPLIRISSCTTCGGGQSIFISHNLLEGNTNQPGPAITFGDPGTAGQHLQGPTTIADNNFYWPVATGVPNIGPESASSGKHSLDNLTFTGNNLSASAPTGGAVWVNANDGTLAYLANNRRNNLTADQSSSPVLFGTSYSAGKATFGLQSYTGTDGGGALANSIAAFDANGVNVQRASYHSMAGPVLCLDSSGSGTAQSCSTAPDRGTAGALIAITAGDQIVYKTTTTNTGDVTIAVNGGSAIHVRKNQGGAVLAAGELLAGVYIPLTYDGTYWEIPITTSYVAPLTVSGTIATDTPALSATQTWNNAAIVFKGIFTNFVGTAFDGSSLLIDLQRDNVSRFSVDAYGNFMVSSTLNAAAGFRADYDGNAQVKSTGVFAVTSGLANGAKDAGLSRLAAGAWAAGNGTAGNMTATIQAGVTATDPGCTTTAHIGKVWFDITTTTTVEKHCWNVAGTLTWHTIP